MKASATIQHDYKKIPISDIKRNSQQLSKKTIDWDDVRQRICTILDNIVDATGKKYSDEEIGKFLFPRLGANSSTQSTVSRFRHPNNGKFSTGERKPTNDIKPDLEALARLSKLTDIPLEWFIWGDTPLSNVANKKSLQDYARLIFMNMRHDLGARYKLVGVIGNTTIPIDNSKIDKCTSFLIEIPIDYDFKQYNGRPCGGTINPGFQAQRDFVQCAYNIISTLEISAALAINDFKGKTIGNKIDSIIDNAIKDEVSNMKSIYIEKSRKIRALIDDTLEDNISNQIELLPVNPIINSDGYFQYPVDGAMWNEALREPFHLKNNDGENIHYTPLVMVEHHEDTQLQFAIDEVTEKKVLIGKRKTQTNRKPHTL